MKTFWIILLALAPLLPAQESTTPLSDEEADLREQALLIANFDGQKRRRPEDASIKTRPNARAITRAVPAPRGVIYDRNGKAMARNKVAYYFGIQFPQFAPDVSDADVLSWARRRLGQVADLTGNEIDTQDNELLSHYKDRRWIPLLLPHLATESQHEDWSSKLMRGLVLQAVYLRDYPYNSSAAHIIGYVRSKGKMPTGPITLGEPMWEETDGEEGLEKTMDKELAGRPGEWTLLVDEDGERLQDELTKKPVIGNSIITTIDMDWQRHAESVLRSHCRRGAYVVVDIRTGEIIVLASRPSYDINKWIPFISSEVYQELKDDPASPMFGRAFQGVYPPASTFKPVVALTALTNNEIDEYTTFNCPAYITVGSRKFWNHTRKAAGRLSVKQAIALSNNPWFFQVGMKVGPSSFLSVARRMGYGTTSGTELYNEKAGIVPTNEYMIKKEGRPFTDGDTVNVAIGQGSISSTPLQVAQMMAAIGNGEILPRLRLILQVQDAEGGVLEATVPEKRNSLGLSSNAVRIVRTGMMQVVHADYGTGKSGGTNFCRVAGKTGTAQWRGSGRKEQWLAWFAGFLPYDNPRYAFAILYEGAPGESVSGGRRAAPMVGRFFNRFGGEIMEKAAMKITLPEDEISAEEEEPEGDEMDRDSQRDLIRRALPMAGDTDEENGLPRAIPVEEDEENGEEPAKEEDLGRLREIPPLRPLRAEHHPEDDAANGDDLPQAVPVEENEEAPAQNE